MEMRTREEPYVQAVLTGAILAVLTQVGAVLAAVLLTEDRLMGVAVHQEVHSAADLSVEAGLRVELRAVAALLEDEEADNNI